MTRAAKICSAADCPNVQPCPVPGHSKQPWASSRRRERTTSGWEQQRRARRILARYEGICHVCGRPGADEVDHVIPLGDPWNGPDTDDNLRPIHERPCHVEKTQLEAQQARSTST